MKKIVLFFIILFSLSTLIVVAQSTTDSLESDTIYDLSLEELMNINVFTASKKIERQDLTPNVVYVITEKEIKNNAYHSIEDLIQKIPGFFTSHTPLGPVMQVRGIAPNENNKVSIMVDGHRVNNVNESYMQTLPLTLDNAERVEVIVGPGAVLYGVESLVATINIITKKIDGVEVSSTYGSYSTIIQSILFGRKLDAEKNISAYVSFSKSKGYESADFYRHSGERIGAEGSDTRTRTLGTIRPSYYMNISGKWDGLTIAATSYNQAMPEYSTDRPMFGIKATRYNYVNSVVMNYRHEIAKDLNFNVKFAGDAKRMLRTIESGATANGLDVSQNIYWNEYSLSYAAGKHYAQGGLQGQYQNNRHNYSISGYDPTTTTPGAVVNILDNKDTYIIGGYLSEEYKPTDNLIIVAALRADRHSVVSKNKVFISPRASVVYSVNPGWTVKAMFNKAVKYPNPWETELNQVWNYDRGATWAAGQGPAYFPEELQTFEVQNIIRIGNLRLSVNAYYQELTNFIGWSKSFTNVGDFKGTGIEVDAKYMVNTQSYIWLNGSYQNADFKAIEAGDHGELQNPQGKENAVPAYVLNTGGSVTFLKYFTLSPSIRYFTKQVVKQYNIPDFLINGKDNWDAYLATPQANYRWTTVKNVFYVDMALIASHVFTQHLDIRINARNILDNRKRVSLQYANGDFQPIGRYVEGTVALKF